MKILWKRVLELTFGLSQLGLELTEDITAEVVLLASYLYQSGTPEEVRCVIGSGCVFYWQLVCREKILAEESIVSILEIEAILHPLCLDPLPVRTVECPELSLVLLLLARVYSLLEEIVPKPVMRFSRVHTYHVVEYLYLAELEVTIVHPTVLQAERDDRHVVKVIER